MSASPRARTHHQVLASASRTAVLQALRDAGTPLGVADVTDLIGLHQNTVRGHLDVLVDAGYAVRRSEPPRGPGRPRIVYEATNAPEDGSNYKLLAEVLAEYVASTAADPGRAAAAAGRAWATATQVEQTPTGPKSPGTGSAESAESAESAGSSVAAAEQHADAQAVLDGLVRMLADGGFQPEVIGSGGEVHLHHCPFGDLAVQHPDVVCGAHLGIIQAGVERLGGPAGGARLLPFVQPGLCITRVDGRVPDDDAPTGTHDAGRPA